MNGGRNDDQLRVSVEGVWCALVAGDWTCVPAPNPDTIVAEPRIPDGYISIEASWFRTVSGQLEPTASPMPAAKPPSPPIPDGYISVEGALMRATPNTPPKNFERATAEPRLV